MLRVTGLTGRVDDAAGYEFEQPKDRQPPGLRNSFGALQSLEEKVCKISVAGVRIFPAGSLAADAVMISRPSPDICASRASTELDGAVPAEPAGPWRPFRQRSSSRAAGSGASPESG